MSVASNESLRAPDYSCYLCGRGYKHYRNLWRHQKYECNSYPDFVCLVENCEFKTRRNATLNNHMRMKHNIDIPKGHTCGNCSKWYNYKRNLYRHLRDECGKAAFFKCPYCENTTKRYHSLNKHVLPQHDSGISRNVMESGLGQYNYYEDLNKVHLCKLCGNRYKYRRSLVKHVKYECNKQGIFICTICQRSFKQKAHLKYHVSHLHKDVDVAKQ
ncbi:hypothetical protein ILUMI_02795 [Ignelater luminosus]|uniref:C2H2-type domain-containing protein n=1 Tax=Ignelater luminosus TaxID=2038154 RepID=A0A8K0DFU9_IGNLU|nr:hypothetical protein ILUMI_02795 [Ignelater luminosus]